MATSNVEESNLSEYLDRFNNLGFDDLEFLQSLTDEERQETFIAVGLSVKPGHLVKFRKALTVLCNKSKQKEVSPSSANTEVTQPRKVQKSKCTSD